MATPCSLTGVDLPDESKALAVPEEDAKVATHGWKPRTVREVKEVGEVGIAPKTRAKCRNRCVGRATPSSIPCSVKLWIFVNICESFSCGDVAAFQRVQYVAKAAFHSEGSSLAILTTDHLNLPIDRLALSTCSSCKAEVMFVNPWTILRSNFPSLVKNLGPVPFWGKNRHCLFLLPGRKSRHATATLFPFQEKHMNR